MVSLSAFKAVQLNMVLKLQARARRANGPNKLECWHSMKYALKVFENWIFNIYNLLFNFASVQLNKGGRKMTETRTMGLLHSVPETSSGLVTMIPSQWRGRRSTSSQVVSEELPSGLWTWMTSTIFAAKDSIHCWTPSVRSYEEWVESGKGVADHLRPLLRLRQDRSQLLTMMDLWVEDGRIR